MILLLILVILAMHGHLLGYTTINSYFGYRTSPTAGASSYHSGLDIGAPEGSKLIAVTSGEITFTGFLGGGGYTITLTTGNIKFTYCHVSPFYIVKTGDKVVQGQVIGYSDNSGNSTGPHLHFEIRPKGGGSGEYGSTNPLPYIGINGFGDGQGVGTYVGG